MVKWVYFHPIRLEIIYGRTQIYTDFTMGLAFLPTFDIKYLPYRVKLRKKQYVFMPQGIFSEVELPKIF